MDVLVGGGDVLVVVVHVTGRWRNTGNSGQFMRFVTALFTSLLLLAHPCTSASTFLPSAWNLLYRTFALGSTVSINNMQRFIMRFLRKVCVCVCEQFQ